MQQSVAIELAAQGRESSHGHAVVVTLDPEVRGRRARRAAGICLGIGVVSLAIPLVHFVLPWLMVIIATVVYRRVQGQGAELDQVSGPCPACGAAVSLPRQPLEWPVEWNCEACRKRLTITPAGGEAGQQES